MLLYFSLTLFVSALLLFLVEPMVGKMVLPQLGGTPAVWNTCLVFFQATLLLGYLYAHITSKLLSLKLQVVVHLLVLALPFLALPIDIAAWGAPDGDSNPIPWLLMVLACTVGPAFFVVSASAPILQRWFAGTGHPAAKDPYFLYSASNLGSMVALLSYPLVVEPQLRLGEQSWVWMVCYGVLGLFIAGCGMLAFKGGASPVLNPESPVPAAPAAPLTLSRRLRWLALSAVPSSLLLGFTTYLTTDIAAIPLLWVLPLTVYLLTFILVFARKPPLPHVWMVRFMPLFVLTLLLVLLAQAIEPLWMILAIHLMGFFMAAMMCHGELATDRPDPAHLTEFYLIMSLGGVLGGLLNVLVAPLVFDSVAEYPLMLVAACFLLPRGQEEPDPRTFTWSDLRMPLILLVIGPAALYGLNHFAPELVRAGTKGSFAVKVLLGALAVLCFPLSRRPVRFGLAVSVMLIVGLLAAQHTDDVVYATRSFYGVHRVVRDVTPAGEPIHKLVHGNTNHGMQSLVPANRLKPLAYYDPKGPLGQVFADLKTRQPRPAAAVLGLGSGCIASYLDPGQSVTFYEIDPSVVRIAQTPEHFTFLAATPGKIDVVLGDGRLTLARAPEGAYGLILMDAFSSDAIPLHLITREALALYLTKLAPDGVLVFHISNRYLNLEPVVGDLAGDANLACRALYHAVDPASAEGKAGYCSSHCVILSRDAARLDSLTARDSRWRTITPRPGVRVWTDDFSNIFSVLK